MLSYLEKAIGNLIAGVLYLCYTLHKLVMFFAVMIKVEGRRYEFSIKFYAFKT